MEFLSKMFYKMKHAVIKEGKDRPEDEEAASSIPRTFRNVPQTSYGCDGCRATIQLSDWRFHCSECPNYDFCEACFKSKAHPHHMARETGNPALVVANIKEAKNLWKCFSTAFSHFGDRRLCGTIRTQPDDSLAIEWVTYDQVLDRVLDLVYGIRAKLGSLVKPGTIVGICGQNRVDWLVADLALTFLGCTIVPIHYTLDADSYEFILKDSTATLLIVDHARASILATAAKKSPLMKAVILMDKESKPAVDQIFAEPGIAAESSASASAAATDSGDHVKVRTMGYLEKQGKKSPNRCVTWDYHLYKPQDMETIVYTSGSTGRPKGVVHTEQSWLLALNNGFFNRSSVITVDFSFAPFAHTTPRRSIHLTIMRGGSVVFSRGDMNKIFDDIKVTRPTILSSTPRLWTVLHGEYLKAKQLARQENIAIEDEEKRLSEGQIEAKLRSTFRRMLGDRLETIVTGGAPTPPAVLQWLQNTFLCWVENGYGTSETAGIFSENHVRKGVEVKLIDVPELGYYLTDKNPRGEICVKSPSLFAGYWKQPELTQESFVDGWYRTGDVGEMIDGSIKLIDRRKNFFKMAQGEFIAPEGIEKVLSACELVQQLFVHGDPLKHYLVAVVVPNKGILASWKEKNKLMSPTQMAEALKAHILHEFAHLAQGRLQVYELPRAVYVEEELEFTADNGLLTATFKTCRPKLKEHYKATFVKLYRDTDAADTENRIKQLLARAVHANDIDATKGAKSLADMGGDSLAAVRLVEQIKAQFNVAVPVALLLGQQPGPSSDEDISDKLSQFILDQQKQQSSSSDPKPSAASGALQLIDFKKDTKLPKSIKPNSTETTATADSQVVFLTGVTGFLGVHLLYELLHVTPAPTKILCLVRAETADKALQRIRSKMEAMHLRWHSVYNAIVVPVLGDLLRPNFGLSDDTFEALGNETTAIYHCGAWVNGIFDYHTLKTANIDSAYTILRLASPNSAVVNYISTVSVLTNRDLTVPALEEFVDFKSAPTYSNGYAQSKWAAEMIFKKAKKRGFKVIITRPSTITASTKSGIANLEDFAHRVWKAFIVAGVFPRSLAESTENEDNKQRLNWIPVDYCAKYIVAFGQAASTFSGRVLHVVSHHQGVECIRGQAATPNLTWKIIIEATKSYGVKMKALPSYAEWRNALFFPSEAESGKFSNPLSSLQSYFLGAHFPKGGGAFQCNGLADLTKLNPSLVLCPPLSDEYFHNVLKKSNLSVL